MRCGDIFMGAFSAEQVMYNHFGYRTPIANLYYAGSAAHPGGAVSGGPVTLPPTSSPAISG
jgi:phytoene dehydrogenase-like protein